MEERIWKAAQHVACAVVLAASVTAPVSAASVEIPHMEARSLAGSPVLLPSHNGKPVVLVFGFTRSAKAEGVAWGTELTKLQGTLPGFDFYQVAMLSGAPHFTHKLISRAIRAEVPAAYRSHFLLVSTGESEWRKLLHADDNAVSYVALSDAHGKLLWTTKGSGKQQFESLSAELHHALAPNHVLQ